ncbi:MAG: hypothetical protein QOI02_1350 [Actinomycetota bacterium]|nr:hypothetical protein [Actinomycetota bacterium]
MKSRLIRESFHIGLLGLAVAMAFGLSGCASELQVLCHPSIAVTNSELVLGESASISVDTCASATSYVYLTKPAVPLKPGEIRADDSSLPSALATVPSTQLRVPTRFRTGKAKLILVPDGKMPKCIEECGYPEVDVTIVK